jgi:hypothetical protein
LVRKNLAIAAAFFSVIAGFLTACTAINQHHLLTNTGQPTTITPTPTFAGNPVIQLIYPRNKLGIDPDESVNIQSIASVSLPRYISRIELWSDGSLYKTVLNSNPNLAVMLAVQSWSSPDIGSHILRLIAYDSQGQASAPVDLDIDVASANLPSAWIAQPYSKSGEISVQTGESVTIDYWGYAATGVDHIDLWSNGLLYATDISPDHSSLIHVQHVWSSIITGHFSLYARVYDIVGKSYDSSSITIEVVDRKTPFVEIVSPGNNGQITNGQVIPIIVSASDAKGINHLE